MENVKNLNVIGIVAGINHGGIISNTVSFITKSKYVHVEFLLSDMKTTYGSRPPTTGSSGGVGYYSIDDGYMKNYKIFLLYNPCDKTKVLYDKEDQEIIKKQFEELNSGAYDVPGIFGFLFNKPSWNKQDKWWCSELIFYITSKTKFPILNPNINKDGLVSPKDILYSTYLFPFEKEQNYKI